MLRYYYLRSLSSGTLRPSRTASGWSLGNLFRKKETPQQQEEETQEPSHDLEKDQSVSQEQLLERLAQSHVKDIGSQDWKLASLGDIHLKGKILCDFESTFSYSIPNQDLGYINIFADLLAILETSSSLQPQEAPTTYPNIKNDGSLPSNLSIQFINIAPRPKPKRQPFQNYDAGNPIHANFLTKEEKERRKRKRRHLTALK